MSSSNGEMFTLRSGDGEKFEVEEAVVMQSGTLKHLIEDVKADDTIPVPKVTGKTLCKVIEFCEKHAGAGDRSTDAEIKAWDANFVKVDLKTLNDLLLAADYLDIKELLDLTCHTLADMMKGKSHEEMRTMFNIDNDFTSEEEEEIRRESAWALQ